MMTRQRCGRFAMAMLAVLSLLGSSGCMSYRTGGIPDVRIPRTAGTPARTAFVDVRCSTQNILETVPRENVALSQQWRPVIARVLNDSGLIKSCTFSARNSTNADLQVILSIEQKENGWLWTAAVSGASLCIIPCTWSESYRLTADIVDTRAQRKRQYQVADSMRTWVEVLLLPFSPWKSQGKVQKQLIENMVRTVLASMNKDGFLPNSE